MQMRKLGRTSLEVAPLCLGGNVFGWTADEAASFAVLDAYFAGGGNFIDTADVYATWKEGSPGGDSETVLGRWFQARGTRERIVLVTKVGSQMGQDPDARGLSRRHIMASIEGSLRRLQTDYIDVYMAHRDDSTTPFDETLAAFDDLVKQGKARTVAASNYSAERLALALQESAGHEYARFECYQPPYHLLNRRVYEGDVEALCQKEGLGVITYSALASGFLSGKYRSDAPLPSSKRAAGIQNRYMNDKGFAVLQAVEQVAARLRATPAQVALAWIMARPGITAPIASATSVEQVHELLGAVNLHLDTEAVALLDQASAESS